LFFWFIIIDWLVVVVVCRWWFELWFAWVGLSLRLSWVWVADRFWVSLCELLLLWCWYLCGEADEIDLKSFWFFPLITF
jgi:hypothetical protein